jgi:hypothetical protein
MDESTYYSGPEEWMKHRLVLMISVAGLLLASEAASASATPAHAQRAASQPQYCVAEAEPAGSTVTPTATCYASFAASIAAATGGRIRLPASTKPSSITRAEISAWNAVPANTFVLSIDWKDANFTGPSLTWTQSSDCGSFQAAGMPSGWNDVVSSVVTSADCANSLFQNSNFGGSRLDISKNTSRGALGSFNDLTSSEKWCTSKPC